MSDGALSQDEIDSLLAGLDPNTGGSPSPSAAASASAQVDLSVFGAILSSLSATHAQTVSMMTGSDAVFSAPKTDVMDREGLLPRLPDEVLAIKIDIIGGIPGDHLFLLPADTALKIASLANQDDSLSELDDMAISVVSECISSLTGSVINVLTDKTANQSLQSGVADGAFGPKAIARLPGGPFVAASWDLSIEGMPFKMWEVFSMPFVKDIIAASAGQKHTAAMPSAGAISQPGMMFQQPMPGQRNMHGMMGSQGMYQSPFMAQPNVQPVQFANLGMGVQSHESGNIGLIMDVYMELTVELGRTKKLIKDILGIGEGTIIELDKQAGDPVDILVNHKLIAKGEVVVIDENFGVRVTEIVSPMERMTELS